MEEPVVEVVAHGEKFITYKGETHNIKEWAEKIGVSAVQLGARIRNKPPSEWFKPNKRNKTKYLTVDGVTRSVREWSEITGIPTSTIFQRISKGLPPEEIFKTAGLSGKTKRLMTGEVEPVPEVDKHLAITLEFDPDLELKRRIKQLEMQGVDEDEIYIKLRKAA